LSLAGIYKDQECSSSMNRVLDTYLCITKLTNNTSHIQLIFHTHPVSYDAPCGELSVLCCWWYVVCHLIGGIRQRGRWLINW